MKIKKMEILLNINKWFINYIKVIKILNKQNKFYLNK